MPAERVSIALEPELLKRFDAIVKRSGHSNRSEALRDLIRDRLVEEEWLSKDRGDAVATVTLVYDHHKRELPDRLLDAGHTHHHEIVASMHVHLDHDMCMEVIALRGKPKALRHIADHLIGMKGVQHGRLVISSAKP